MWVVNRLPKIKILEHHYLEFDIPKFKKKSFLFEFKNALRSLA